MARPTNKYFALLYYAAITLVVLISMELFKYQTKKHYEWFHCSPVAELIEGSESTQKLYAVGSSACDKRGQLKTITEYMTRNYDPNEENYSFCLIENKDVPSVHYPVDQKERGSPGYFAYVGFDREKEIVQEHCDSHKANIFHL